MLHKRSTALERSVEGIMEIIMEKPDSFVQSKHP